MTDASGSDRPNDPTTAPADAPPPSTSGPAYPPPPTPKKVSTPIKILAAVLGVAIFAGAYFGVRALFEAFSGPSKQELIEKNVEEALKIYSLPQQIDQVTVLTDITAESDAIHYHYTLVDVDPADVSADVLSGIVLPGLCSTKETRALLDREVGMKYSYLVESTGDTYDLEFGKNDC